MVWNSDWPVGTSSVKANQVTGNQNTVYIETTMGNDVVGTNNNTVRDHFWDVDATLDGRHRFIQSVGFTEGGNPANPVLGDSMDTLLYPKTTNGSVQWFHKNIDADTNIYQVTPNQLTSTVVLTSSYATVVAVPANVWGEIFMYATSGTSTQNRYRTIRGFFRSDASIVNSFAYTLGTENDDYGYGVRFGNGSNASGLDIRARVDDATSGLTWTYIVWYRAL